MVVNKTTYPDRETSLSAIQLTSTQPSNITLDSTWDTTIAISQSTSELAAFNKVTYVAYDPVNPNEFPTIENVKPIQKIGLYYTQDYTNFARHQVYNGSVSYDGASYFIGDMSSAYYSFYSLRRYPAAGWTGGLISAMQARYNRAAYYLITGLNLHKAICVICVGFTDGSYCSYKYYEDHKIDIPQTPMCLFMIGLIDNDQNGNTLQTMCPIDVSNFTYTFFRRAGTEITSDSRDIEYLLPNGIIGPQTHIGDRNTVGAINNGALVFPLVGCMAGRRINVDANYWSRYSLNGTPIYGGSAGVDYTIVKEDNWVHTVLTQAGYDTALRAAACYGLPFSLDFPTRRYGFYEEDQDLTTFLPSANEGGYFDGSYDVLTNQGIKTELYNTDPIFNGGKDAPYTGRDYDPNVPIPVNDIQLTTPTLTSAGAFFTSYILNNSDLVQLAKSLNSNEEGIIDNLINSLKLYGNTPIDAFISLQLFPLDVKETTGANSLVNVMVGRVEITDPSTGDTLKAYKVPRNALGILDLGEFEIIEKFKCYLDYEPYTTIQLYIPYCGTVNLQPSIFVGHKVKVKMAVDWITGACAAVVMVSTKDGYKPIEYVNGQLGQNIQMTASSYAQNYASVVATGVKGIGQALMGAGMLAVGNPAGTSTLGSGLSNLWEANSKWHETEFKTSGSNSPGANNYFPKQCYITISYPIPMIDNERDLGIYGRSNGFACVKTIRSLDELIATNSAYGTMQAAIQTFELPDPQGLGYIPLTAQEVEMIKKLLAEGFSIASYQEPSN